MKRKSFLIMCFVALASFVALSCDEKENNNEENNTNSEAIVGTWMVKQVLVNGEEMTPENMLIIMNSDGTGLLNDNGVTENNEFTWSLNGDQLTINHRHGSPVFTVKQINENEFTITGDTVPGFDQPLGEVIIDLERVR